MRCVKLSVSLPVPLIALLTALTLSTALCGQSCRGSRTASNSTHDTCYYERLTVDTVVRFEADSALMRALFECDSAGNVLMTELQTVQGQRVSVAPKFKYVVLKNDNGRVQRDVYMAVLAYADSLQTQVYGFKKRLSAAKTELKQAKNRTERQGRRMVVLFLAGLFCGGFLTALVFIKALGNRKWY